MPPNNKKNRRNEIKSDKKKNLHHHNDENDDQKIKTKTTGLDEIDALFEDKKTIKKRKQQEEQEAVREEEAERKRQKQEQNDKKSKLQYNRHDILQMSDREWVDDGLGGKFNSEGFTGRKHDGVKVFKAHLFNKPNFGDTKDCPFDCDCCYI
mmetsp:Transcript_26524/g.37385  ORF Transcript_26524/g.37385 Transcript_26524/m.37385 type:complete len:152 (+) Transcript_26524:211-666(+)